MKKLILFFICCQVALCAMAQTGNVGIGTSTPHSSAVLDLKSSNKGFLVPRVDDFTNAIANPAKGLVIYDSSRTFFYYYNGADWKQLLNSDDQYWARSSNRVFLVNNSDKVGIGTSNPTGRLQINHRNTASSPALTLVDSSTGTGSSIFFSKLGGASSFTINSIITPIAANDELNIQHGSTAPVLTIKGDNKVGINTASPTAALQVNHKSTGIAPTLTLFDSTGGGGNVVTFAKQGFTASMQIFSGITSNTASGNSLNIQHSGGSPVFTVKGDGKIGINEESPTSSLEVRGTVKADTVRPTVLKITPNAGNGKVLTSDAGGIAAWENLEVNNGGGIGFGSWGDCSMNSISEFQPVTDTSYNVADFFGSAVSISGDYAVIGSPGDDPNNINNAGSANIYKHNGSSWVLLQKITDLTPVTAGHFGYSVSMAGNFLIIGADGDIVGGVSKGSASIYQFNGTSWAFMQKITDAGGSSGDDFGYSVCLSGNYIITGAPNDDVGAATDHGSASIFQYNGSSWVFMQKLTGTIGNNGDNLGKSVSISGTTAIIGEPDDDVGANANQGSAFIYEYNGINWILNVNLFDNSGAAGDQFGFSVAVSGNYAIVGSPYDDLGANADQGSIVVYRKSGVNWVLMEKITDASTTAGDQFGYGLKFSGNYFIVGAPTHNNGGNLEQGSSTIYVMPGNYIQKLQYIVEQNGKLGDRLGYDVAVDGNTKRFLLGADKTGCVGLCFTAPGKAVFGKIN